MRLSRNYDFVFTNLLKNEAEKLKGKSGVNFINVLRAAFTPADPKSAKKTVRLNSFVALSGSALVKSAHRMLVKLSPDPTSSRKYSNSFIFV